MPLRLLLLSTAPIWAPFLLLFGLARICGDGLLFVMEGYGSSLEIAGPARWAFDAFALVAFPVVITVEKMASFLMFLGGVCARFLRLPVDSGPGRAFLGVPMLALAPIWAPLAALVWMIRRLVWGQLVTAVADRLTHGSSVGRSGRFETFVALRYMRGRKAAAGVSVVTALTIGGVAIGVWALVVVLSVMAGFEVDLQDKILGANSHIVALSYDQRIEDWRNKVDRVREIDGIIGVTPFVYTEFLLRSKHKVTGAIFKGIDPETVAEVTDLVDNLILGPKGRVTSREEALEILRSLDDPIPPEAIFVDRDDPTDPKARKLPGIVIGKEMAHTLRVTVGDVIQGYSPIGEPGPLGGMQARVVPYVVAATFHSGMYEYDTKFSYTNLKIAQDFLRMGDAVTGLEIKVDDIYDAPAIAGLVGAKLQYPIWTRDWQEMNAPLFAALRLEKVVMGIILTFIIAVAALNIISTLIMLVVEKGPEIAIMKAMGAGRGALMRLFIIDGLIIGFIGTVIGLAGGLTMCAALARWQFIPLESDVYYVDRLPVNISPTLVAIVALVAVAISFLATLWPAWEAASIEPVEGLRDA
jgi:lipoprotein-releasing system permease protein